MKLLEFPHSHYCEKARWALDYKGIPFEPVAILPGFHFIRLRHYPESFLPLLLHQGGGVQGSGQIISYLDEQYAENPLTPSDAEEKRACLELECTLDRDLGENIRRILYHRLLAYPAFIRYHFTHCMPAYKQWLFRLTYPILRYKIRQTYLISEQSVKQAEVVFERTLGILAQRLENSNYMIGDRFTRADVTAASMLAFVAMPAEHPFPWIKIPDPEIQALYAAYHHHPVIEWTRKIYRLHRPVSASKI